MKTFGECVSVSAIFVIFFVRLVRSAPSESEPPPFFDYGGHPGGDPDVGQNRRVVYRDPCFDLFCGHGRVCKTSEDGLSAECICRPRCPTHHHQVCGSDGVLYVNHCELHRTACREGRRIAVDDLDNCISADFGDDTKKQETNKKQDKISNLVLNKRKYPKADGTEDPWKFLDDDFTSSTTQIPATSSTEYPIPCQPLQYEIMKDNLMLYHHEKVIGHRPSEADYLISLMFSHYDRNNDGTLEKSELQAVSMAEDLKNLASGCDLGDLLLYDDENKDGVLNNNEFYEAFSKLYSVSVVSLDKALQRNEVQTQVGENIEIKCDVTGSPVPPIIWKRYNVDLLSLKDGSIQVFHDGSLYISDVQLTHGGVYSCHAERNTEVVQTHILNVTTVPTVQVTPAIQALAPGGDAVMECWAASQSPAKVAWLKNDEPLPLSKVDKYQFGGEGRTLTVKNLAYADTGAYMCEATNNGCFHRGISSLVIQDQPQPTVKPAPSLLLVFSGEGIGLYDPESCRIIRQIQGTDLIPGTQRYVCSGDSQVLCRWGDVVNVNESYVYATQPDMNRIIVLNLAQMGVTEAIDTDGYPAQLQYVEAWDQLWVTNWRGVSDAGNKTIQVIRKAAQKGPHQIVHPEPIQSHFDVAYRLFLPRKQELDVKWRYGYVGHSDQRGLYKLDLKDLRFIRVVDLAPYNCIPQNAVFLARYGMVVLECKEPITGNPSGQLILDYLSDSVIQYKPDFHGTPKASPDSLFVVTVNRQIDASFMLGIQKAEADGLHFQFDVRTSLDISQLSFFPSYERHSFDLYASSGEKPDLLYLNLDSGHVEVLTGVGEGPETPLNFWNLPLRSLVACPNHFHPYVATTSRQAVFITDGKEKAVNCEIGSLLTPQRLIWIQLPTQTS